MNEYIKSDFLLQRNALGNLFAVKLIIFFFGDISLLKRGTVCFNIRSLRERTYCSCRKNRKFKFLFLDFFSFVKFRKSCKILFLNASNSFLNSVIIAISSVFKKLAVSNICGFILKIIRICKKFKFSKLNKLFFCKGEMACIFSRKLSFIFKCIRNMK